MNLKATGPETVHDLAGNEWRRVQKAEGYRWTIVNGEIIFEGGTAHREGNSGCTSSAGFWSATTVDSPSAASPAVTMGGSLRA